MKQSSHSRRPTLLSGAAFGLLAAMAASGCGGAGSKTTLTGKVTYKGQPVPGLLILSMNISGTPATYPIQVGEDGKFSFSGAPKGTYKVAMTPAFAVPVPPPLPPGVAPPPGMDLKQPPTAGAVKQLKYVNIPLKYLQPLSSGITWEVKEGSQRKDFELTD